VFPTHEHTEHHHKLLIRDTNSVNYSCHELYDQWNRAIIKCFLHMSTQSTAHIITKKKRKKDYSTISFLQMTTHNILICVTNSVRLSSRIWSTWQHIAAHTCTWQHRHHPTIAFLHMANHNTLIGVTNFVGLLSRVSNTWTNSAAYTSPPWNPNFFRRTNYAGILGFCWYQDSECPAEFVSRMSILQSSWHAKNWILLVLWGGYD